MSRLSLPTSCLLFLLATPWLARMPMALAAEPGDSACSADGSFPGATWPDRSAELAAANPAALAALEAYLFPPALDWSDPERRGIRTDGVVIIQGGAIVYERYENGYTAETPHLAWSASKSFANAMVGVAQGAGLLDVESSICTYLPSTPAWSCAVNVRQAMEFASGWDWHEAYEGQSPTSSSVLAMLYGEGQQDMAAFVTSHPRRNTPDETWSYSSGDSNVVSAVAGAVMAPRFGEQYPWKVLFEPIGMSSAVWERDGAGTYVGSSYLYATPRDFARFGWLLRQDGCWAGEQILPPGWVQDSTQVSVAFQRAPLGYEGGAVQGRMFWVNRPVPSVGLQGLPWPSAPEGAFAALGHWRQAIYVIPDADLVIARNGDDRDDTYQHDETLRLALALVGYEAAPAAPTEPYQPVPGAAPKGKPASYDNSLFRLAAGFSAQEVCSCVFVMGRDEDFCAEWTRVHPDVAHFRVDYEAKTVRARALGMGRTLARYTGEHTGCVIED